ncbi:MAG TPA: nuclear transport factor 2 family protein [Gemmatimonadales bacterium]|nr:nuclear transport factor 2 family protein [Gemmatimonadales bacterium]
MLIRATFLTVLLITACTRAPATGAPAPETAASAIRAVLDSTAAGWNRGDLSRYLWAYVDSATAMGGNGPERGVGAIEGQMRRGFWRTGRPLQTLHYEHVEVRMLGDEHALVTGQFVLTGGGQPQRTGWFTTVWMRTPVGWRMMHDHSS